ncbi:hypothetical protein HAX54_039313 [Datura stramonium]|uniref:Uncharacterized protein n=1 Tax=Datura stramonium TaxID=4076 RepID=A0ABS8VL38_DATST|nr:hypothetical protein [Datura stramonium]
MTLSLSSRPTLHSPTAATKRHPSLQRRTNNILHTLCAFLPHRRCPYSPLLYDGSCVSSTSKKKKSGSCHCQLIAPVLLLFESRGIHPWDEVQRVTKIVPIIMSSTCESCYGGIDRVVWS